MRSTPGSRNGSTIKGKRPRRTTRQKHPISASESDLSTPPAALSKANDCRKSDSRNSASIALPANDQSRAVNGLKRPLRTLRLKTKSPKESNATAQVDSSVQENEAEFSESGSVIVVSSPTRATKRRKKHDTPTRSSPISVTSTSKSASRATNTRYKNSRPLSNRRSVPVAPKSTKSSTTVKRATLARQAQGAKSGTSTIEPQYQYVLDALQRFHEEIRHCHNDENNPVYRENMNWLWSMSVNQNRKLHHSIPELTLEPGENESEIVNQCLPYINSHRYALPSIWLKDLETILAREIFDKFCADCEIVFENDNWEIKVKDLLKVREVDLEWLAQVYEDEARDSYFEDDIVRSISAEDFERGKEFLRQRGLPCKRLLARFVCPNSSEALCMGALRTLEDARAQQRQENMKRAIEEVDGKYAPGSICFGTDGSTEEKRDEKRVRGSDEESASSSIEFGTDGAADAKVLLEKTTTGPSTTTLRNRDPVQGYWRGMVARARRSCSPSSSVEAPRSRGFQCRDCGCGDAK